MKLIKRIFIAIVVLLVLAGVYYMPKLKRVYHAMHLFDKEDIVDNFRTVNDWWSSSDIQSPQKKHMFPKSIGGSMPSSFTTNGKTNTIDDYLDKSYATGFLVLQDDSIVFEKYFRGHQPNSEQIVWSVSKSFLSALFGIAMAEGKIENINESVEKYCPILKGSGYEGVKIKDVLQMSTGVGFNEDYADFYSDINRWGRDFSWGNSQDAFAASLKREKVPGTYHHYVSLNTHVLGMVLVKATGKSISAYAEEKLWGPLGMEHDSHWLIDDFGMEAALGGLTTTVRNCAKLGSLFLNNGNWQGKQVVPAQWIKDSTTPDAPHVTPGIRANSAHEFGYGYQWWIPAGDEGEFLAIGVYNQFIYVNPTTRTVVIKHSANSGFNENGFYAAAPVFVEMCRAIANENRKPEISNFTDLGG